MSNETRSNMKQIVAAVERANGDGEVKSWWTKIGVAFENRDGSFNLRFDYVPTDRETTIQLRDFEAAEDRERERGQPRRERARRR
jgi:hypothetical protein